MKKDKVCRKVEMACVIDHETWRNARKTIKGRTNAPGLGKDTHWNPKKTNMYLVCTRDGLDLRTKLEIHPGNECQVLPYTQFVYQVERKFPRTKGEFEKGKCKTCKKNILWVTDPVKGRQPVDIQPRIAYIKVKSNDGKILCERLDNMVYVNHNDTCKKA